MFKLIKLVVVFLTMTISSSFADLSDILKKGEVKIAVPEAFAPFGSVGKTGEHEGYDVDVAKLIAKDLGVKLKLFRLFQNKNSFRNNSGFSNFNNGR